MNNYNIVWFIYHILFFIKKISINTIWFNDNHLIIKIRPSSLENMVSSLKYSPYLRDFYLTDMCCIDYRPYYMYYSVCYFFRNTNLPFMLRIHINTYGIGLLPTVSHIFPTAFMLEREITESFGIIFTGDTDTRRLFQDYGFKSFPLRKEYPLTGYVDVLFDEGKKLVVVVPLELSQELRDFRYDNAWPNWI